MVGWLSRAMLSSVNDAVRRLERADDEVEGGQDQEEEREEEERADAEPRPGQAPRPAHDGLDDGQFRLAAHRDVIPIRTVAIAPMMAAMERSGKRHGDPRPR